MPHSLPNVSTRSTKGSRTSGRKNSIKSPELNPPNVRRHRTNSQTRAIKTITSTTSSTSTTSTSSTSSSSSSTTSGQQPWNKFKIYLHDGIFRTNPSARSSLVRRIRLVGAKIETCYSVGVTHVITISGEELDEATKLLRGAVMRSGFLRSGSRRSKDLLLKAEETVSAIQFSEEEETAKKAEYETKDAGRFTSMLRHLLNPAKKWQEHAQQGIPFIQSRMATTLSGLN